MPITLAIALMLALPYWIWRSYKKSQEKTISMSEWRLRMKKNGIGVK